MSSARDPGAPLPGRPCTATGGGAPAAAAVSARPQQQVDRSLSRDNVKTKHSIYLTFCYYALSGRKARWLPRMLKVARSNPGCG